MAAIATINAGVGPYCSSPLSESSIKALLTKYQLAQSVMELMDLLEKKNFTLRDRDLLIDFASRVQKGPLLRSSQTSGATLDQLTGEEREILGSIICTLAELEGAVADMEKLFVHFFIVAEGKKLPLSLSLHERALKCIEKHPSHLFRALPFVLNHSKLGDDERSKWFTQMKPIKDFLKTCLQLSGWERWHQACILELGKPKVFSKL